MTQEEKAKRYDEALERAKEKYPTCYSPALLEYIFPELKESKDEKIKKSLISYLRGLGEFEYPDKKTYNNWLEKQGKKKSIDYTHTNVFTKKAFIWFNNNFIFHDEYGVISDFDTKEEMFENFKNYMKGE